MFTARLQKRPQLAAQYAKHVFGQRVAVSPQTVAEARYGALKSAWGPRGRGYPAFPPHLMRMKRRFAARAGTLASCQVPTGGLLSRPDRLDRPRAQRVPGWQGEGEQGEERCYADDRQEWAGGHVWEAAVERLAEWQQC